MPALQRLALPLAALFAGLPRATPPGVVARPQWRGHFEAHGLTGAFVLFEPARGRYLVLDEARARTRLPPAATFHVPLAVAGLECGAIDDERELFRWDGRPRPVPAWERDHTFASGLREGVAWMYQEVARRIGRAGLRDWLARAGYGNRDLSGGIDLFWLQGGLRVSAFEQVELLHRLAEGRLPATQRAQRLVRSALECGRSRSHVLYAAGGCAAHGREPVAWWVGWVERQGRPQAVFAMNCRPAAPRAQREAAARAILAEAGALP